MLRFKNIERIIVEYIKLKYPSNQEYILKKHLKNYNKIIEYCKLKEIESNSLLNVNRKQKCNSRKVNCVDSFLLKEKEFELRNDDIRRVVASTIKSKFIKENKIHNHYRCKDVKIADIIKNDLLDMGFLVLKRKKQPLKGKEYIPAVYTWDNFPNNSFIWQYNYSIKDEVQYVGEEYVANTNGFHFEIDELINLVNDYRPEKKRIKGDKSFNKQALLNYKKMMKLYNEGYQIKSHKSFRDYSNITSISPQFRALLKGKDGAELISYDLQSSHLFFLAHSSNNTHLYEDIVSRKIKAQFNKEQLLMWLNSPNFNSKKYKKMNDYAKRIRLNHQKHRDTDGKMYPKLAKVEGEFVLGISRELLAKGIDNFTLHDQIYFIKSDENIREFFELSKELEEELGLKFKPIWVENK